MFRSPQLSCDLSGLFVNVGESMIVHSSNVTEIWEHIRPMIILLIYFEAHIISVCTAYGVDVVAVRFYEQQSNGCAWSGFHKKKIDLDLLL